MSKSRKKVFPKPPVKFHSKLAHELGKWSNKNGYEASIKGIYNQEIKQEPKITETQANQLAKLKANLAKRGQDATCNIEYEW